MARARQRDARALFARRRYDGAAYIGGYALEVALKVRICRTLHWPAFPATAGEFRSFQCLKTHTLETLLAFAGVEAKITSKFTAEWTAVCRMGSRKSVPPGWQCFPAGLQADA